MHPTAAHRRSPATRSPRRALLPMLLSAAALALGAALAQSTLNIGVDAEVSSMDPRFSGTVANQNIMTLLHIPLLVWDNELNIVPMLAESIDNPDDRTYVFTLRQGLTFHDGTEITSADVKYTYDGLRDPDGGYLGLSFYRDIESIETPDPYTVVMTLASPSSPFIYYLNHGIIPMHYVEEVGDERFATVPLGSGPFQFVEWVTGERVVLEAFDGWFEGRPAIDRLVFRPIPDTTVRTIELEIGGVDLVDRIDPLDVERLDMDDFINVTRATAFRYENLGISTRLGALEDVRVRQAIAHMIPKADIVEFILDGVAQVGHSPIVAGSWAHNADAVLEYDPERGAELLAEAGYGDGFETELIIRPDPINRQIAEVIQQELARHGNISLTVSEIESATFFERLAEGTVPMWIAGWGALSDPDRGVYRQFHSRNFPPAGPNRQFYENARADELMDLARTTTDFDERRAYYLELQEILVNDASYVILYYPEVISAASRDLENFAYDPFHHFLGLKDARLNR
jgi:peptide/nickel transport system substrate-binding protein